MLRKWVLKRARVADVVYHRIVVAIRTSYVQFISEALIELIQKRLRNACAAYLELVVVYHHIFIFRAGIRRRLLRIGRDPDSGFSIRHLNGLIADDGIFLDAEIKLVDDKLEL